MGSIEFSQAGTLRLGSSWGCSLELFETISVFVFKYLLSMVEASSRKGSGTWLEFGQRENLYQNQGSREDCTWLATGANKSLQIWFLRLDILKVGRVYEVS